MAGWFGHTQTLTSISKSVSTVASGILGLEDNLATFMKKVWCVRRGVDRELLVLSVILLYMR